MKNILALTIVAITCINIWCMPNTHTPDFASQLLQEGDTIEGYYQLHPLAQHAVSAWLKKFEPDPIARIVLNRKILSSLFTPQHTALDGKRILMKIPLSTQSTIDTISTNNAIIHALGKFCVKILESVALDGIPLISFAMGVYVIGTIKSEAYAEKGTRAAYLIGGAYILKKLLKTLDSDDAYPEVSTVVQLDKNTVIVTLDGLKTVLDTIQRDLLPEGVWVKAETGIPRIARRKTL